MTTSSKLDTPSFLSALFFPREEARSPLPADSTDLDIAVSDGDVVLGCRLHGCDHEAPLLIYFHGNGETVSDYDDIASLYCAIGLNIVIVSYRGYGWSSGVPKVSALFEDSTVIFEYIKSYCTEHGFSGPLFVMGRSLGCICAIELASRIPEEFKGLIIESGFGHTLPLLQRLGCDLTDTDFIEEEGFNNLAKIREITIPTMILHGSRDQLIPLAEAEKLQAESGAKTKQFQVIPGADHNSLITVAGKTYFETIKTFVDTATGKNTWRQRRKRFREKSEKSD